MLNRSALLQKNLSPDTLVLLSKPADITYFSGFQFLLPNEREALLVITSQSAHLLYSSFSPVTKREGILYHPGCSPQNLSAVVSKIITQQKISTVLIDEDTLFVSEKNAVVTLGQFAFKPLEAAVIWRQRMIKDSEECSAIATACALTSQVVTQVLGSLTAGQTELAVAQKIESMLLAHGATPLAFPTIVAFGKNTALPHHQPTTATLAPEMPVLIDAGGSYSGYAADMTRTVWFGDHPTQEFLAIQHSVMSAYRAVIAVLKTRDSVKTPIAARDIDQAARRVIESSGYGTEFIHTTGHGIGLEIHEQPSLSSQNTTEISTGMTITIEPGIYLREKFGFRYENSVLITENGCEELTV
jgi:Xaa-Pro aminopeptidase